MKGVELPPLLLSIFSLYPEDAHQHRFRVADDLLVDDIRVDVDRLHILQPSAAIPRYPRMPIIERLARHLHLLRVHSQLVEEVLVE